MNSEDKMHIQTKFLFTTVMLLTYHYASNITLQLNQYVVYAENKPNNVSSDPSKICTGMMFNVIRINRGRNL